MQSLRRLLGAGGPIVLVMAPTLLCLFLLSWRFDRWIPRPWRLPARILGAGLVLVGVGTILVAGRRLRQARAAGRLCTSGPYRFVRHPLYASWIWLLLPGGTLLLGLWPVLLSAPAMYLVTSRFLAREERRLREQFGAAYAAYAASVPALAPRLGGRQ
jgi:protein-S-isoprenylcysteine O-methyltransferase Ste14